MSSAPPDDRPPTRYRSKSKSSGEVYMDSEETSPTGTGRSPTLQAPAYPPSRYPFRIPLISYCTNEWHQSSRWKDERDIDNASSTYGDQFGSPLRRFFKRFFAMLRAPRVRRYLLFYTVILIISTWLWISVIWPVWAEDRALNHSVSMRHKGTSGGIFGVNVRPAFPHVTQLRDLEPRFIPQALTPKHSKEGHTERLIFVGDVHGCLEDLKALLDKVHFDKHKDHLVTTGDLIAKGPDSAGTVDFVRKLGASCVRGNHEDRVLLFARSTDSTLLRTNDPSRKDVGDLDEHPGSLDYPLDRELAASLSEEQIAYLESCPVILRIGFMEHMGGDLVVVHAGLVPGISLEHQDPVAVMFMRSIDLVTHIPSKHVNLPGSVPWFKLWNRYQKSLSKGWHLFSRLDLEAEQTRPKPTTVIYGHDSKAGLQEKQYSYGIDTGCRKGQKLTALILSDTAAMETVQVHCKNHRQRRPLKEEVDEVLRDGSVGRDKDGSD